MFQGDSDLAAIEYDAVEGGGMAATMHDMAPLEAKGSWARFWWVGGCGVGLGAGVGWGGVTGGGGIQWVGVVAAPPVGLVAAAWLTCGLLFPPHPLCKNNHPLCKNNHPVSPPPTAPSTHPGSGLRTS